MSNIRLSGVVVATVTPFTKRGLIDWNSYKNLLNYCATPRGITSVFVNGHAGEGAALTATERSQVIEFTRKHVGAEKYLLGGVIPYSTADAIQQARDAQAAGADVAVLFPQPQFAAGGTLTPDAPVAYVKSVLDAVDIPVSIFQYALSSGCGYSTETMVQLAQIPGVIAIKEGSDNITAYEDNWRRVKEVAPDVAILPSNFDWFLAQCAVGADGILSGLASLAPHFLINLWQASLDVDLPSMRIASDKLYPIVRAIYAVSPRMDMHTRIKSALKHLNIIDCALPRPPLLAVSEDVVATTARTLDASSICDYVAKSAPPKTL